jgi:hypothetical protein
MRGEFLTCALAIALTRVISASPQQSDPPRPTVVVFETDKGAIEMEVDAGSRADHRHQLPEVR